MSSRLPEDLWDNKPTMTASAGDNLASPCLEDLLREPCLSRSGHTLIQQLVELYGIDLVTANFLDEQRQVWDIPAYLRHDHPDPTWLRRFLLRDDGQGAGEIGEQWLRRRFLQDDPQWLTQLLRRDRANVARVFMLSGNVADYAFDPCLGYRPALELLTDSLQRTKDCVMSISLSQGISVVGPTAKTKAVKHAIEKALSSLTFDPRSPLIPQIGLLFSELRRWLESPPGAQEESPQLDNGLALILPNANLLIPHDGSYAERNYLIDTLLSWSLSSRLFQTKHSIILVAEFLEDVSQELVARGGKIDKVFVPRPSSPDARLKFLMALLQRTPEMKATRYHQQFASVDIAGAYRESYARTLERLSNDTSGLNLLGIEDVIQEASIEGLQLDSRTLMMAKGERLKQESEGLLEIIPADGDLSQLAGYNELKGRLKELIGALREQNRDPLIRATFPMGILFLGPPGTGKTVAAKAIAGESGVNMVKLGDFRGQYVGQSERNLSHILRLIESLYPVIVFMDELDQQEGKRGDSGDSGVSRRVFGKLLEFMSDTSHRGRILWIAASNRPDQIDAAMKRTGRFDLVLPFLLPDQASRKQIFRYLLSSRLQTSQNISNGFLESDWEYCAAKTEGFSGAEIEGLVNEMLRLKAQELMRFEHEVDRPLTIDLALFKEIRAHYEPPAIRKHYREMEDLALKEVRFEYLIPPDYRKRWKGFQGLDLGEDHGSTA